VDPEGIPPISIILPILKHRRCMGLAIDRLVRIIILFWRS
jgi:hypothetical protein